MRPALADSAHFIIDATSNLQTFQMFQIYDVEVSYSEYGSDTALRNVKLAQEIERAAGISDILITKITDMADTVHIKFGTYRDTDGPCPDEENRYVRH